MIDSKCFEDDQSRGLQVLGASSTCNFYVILKISAWWINNFHYTQFLTDGLRGNLARQLSRSPRHSHVAQLGDAVGERRMRAEKPGKKLSGRKRRDDAERRS